VVGVVLLVLAGKLLSAGEGRLGVWARTVGMTALLTALVSGWHYARVWAHFGNPLIGNFDAAAGFPFWQDPGYGTFAYLFHFSRALTDPFFSALYGLPDGLYSTFWGDGPCGGVTEWAYRPPWNYDLMAAGFLLALAPSLFIVLGLAAALLHLVRGPRAEWFLLLALAGGLTVALVYQFLRFPYHGHGRASYELTGMVTVCALAALGIDSLIRLNRPIGGALLLIFGIWACTAFLSYWIRPDSAATQIWIGLQEQSSQHPARALICFRQARKIDPHSIPARLYEVGALLQARQLTLARQALEELVRDEPDNPDALFALAFEYQAEGRTQEALGLLQRTAALAPDDPALYSVLGGLLARQNQSAAAIAAFRKALRITPSNPDDHANLGLLLIKTGQTEQALAQYRRALGLRPDQSSWLADLAWILATHCPPLRTEPYAPVQPLEVYQTPGGAAKR
jgi:tetratricopeptide (TPR) repeat protein